MLPFAPGGPRQPFRTTKATFRSPEPTTTVCHTATCVASSAAASSTSKSSASLAAAASVQPRDGMRQRV